MKTATITISPRLAALFNERVVRSRECWSWVGPINKNGYATIMSLLAHRVSYTISHGPIPDGKVIDHTCRVRSCTNPNHLRVVSPRQNSLENSESFMAKRVASHTCDHGHPWNEENTYWRIRDGKRYRHCRVCQYAAQSRWHQKHGGEFPKTNKNRSRHRKVKVRERFVDGSIDIAV